MTKTTKTSQVTQSESLEEPAEEITPEKQPAKQPKTSESMKTVQEEPAEIQAAGGRPTPLTHEPLPFEQFTSEAPRQQETTPEPSQPEPTKLEEAQPAEEVSE